MSNFVTINSNYFESIKDKSTISFNVFSKINKLIKEFLSYSNTELDYI